MATYELVIDNAKMQIHCNDTAPPAPAMSWKSIRLTPDANDDTNDIDYLSEGDICVLDDDIVVVGSYSATAAHMWAIDMSESTPRIGDVSYWYSVDNEDWAGFPDDPKGYVYGDMNQFCSLGGHVFAFNGEGEETYTSDGNQDNSGTYGPITDIFEVDPTTLEITRTKLAIGLWDDHKVSDGEMTSARWGNKLVLTSDKASGASGDRHSTVFVVSQDGTFDAWELTWGNLSAIQVSGDSAFVWGVTNVEGGSDYHLLEIDLTSGDVTDRGDRSSATSDDNYAWFGCTLVDNRVAWVVMKDHVFGADGGSLDLVLWDPDTLTFSGPFTILSNVDGVGWTGGWYSNVRSISQNEDGNLLIGYTVDSIFGYEIVDPTSGSSVGSGTVDSAVIAYPAYDGFFAQIRPLSDARMVSCYAFQADNVTGQFGTWFGYYN